MALTPFMLVGDGPQEPTGLGRIARDLGAQISATAADLSLDFVQVGGAVPPVWPYWRHYPLDRADDWGAACVEALWRSCFGEATPGILFLVWDPGRLAYYSRLPLPVQKWAYPAVDAGNLIGGVGGPAGEAVSLFDRILGYGRWGSRILKTERMETVPYLPHGLNLRVFAPPPTEEEQAWVRSVLGAFWTEGKLTVGCVATNQPRKDLALYFQTLATLKQRGYPVYGWLHTDVLVKAWSVQELVAQLGLAKQVTVTLDHYTDRQLACLYHACGLTIAPAVEGFGYPIVESLACGVPVIHGDHAGGAELVPKLEWRVPVRAWRVEGIYAQRRPVYLPEDVANAAERALKWKGLVGERVARSYCQGSVSHLDWGKLWPRWAQWLKQGLT